MTASQIKSYVAALVAMLAVVDANTLNLVGELLTPGWAKAFRLAVIFAGILVTGKNQSWDNNHLSLPRAEAEALAGAATVPVDPLAKRAVERIREVGK